MRYVGDPLFSCCFRFCLKLIGISQVFIDFVKSLKDASERAFFPDLFVFAVQELTDPAGYFSELSREPYAVREKRPSKYDKPRNYWYPCNRR